MCTFCGGVELLPPQKGSEKGLAHELLHYNKVKFLLRSNTRLNCLSDNHPAAGERKLSTITCIWQTVMNSLWQEWYQ
jgi:hypothetical protein